MTIPRRKIPVLPFDDPSLSSWSPSAHVTWKCGIHLPWSTKTWRLFGDGSKSRTAMKNHQNVDVENVDFEDFGHHHLHPRNLFMVTSRFHPRLHVTLGTFGPFAFSLGPWFERKLASQNHGCNGFSLINHTDSIGSKKWNWKAQRFELEPPRVSDSRAKGDESAGSATANPMRDREFGYQRTRRSRYIFYHQMVGQLVFLLLQETIYKNNPWYTLW